MYLSRLIKQKTNNNKKDIQVQIFGALKRAKLSNVAVRQIVKMGKVEHVLLKLEGAIGTLTNGQLPAIHLRKAELTD